MQFGYSLVLGWELGTHSARVEPCPALPEWMVTDEGAALETQELLEGHTSGAAGWGLTPCPALCILFKFLFCSRKGKVEEPGCHLTTLTGCHIHI
jgi:hypothetical protein